MMKANVTIVACATLLCTGTAHAATTAEGKCQAERAKAAGAYALFEQEAQAKGWTSGSYDFQKGVSKCRVTYTGTWAKLQKKGALAGSSCVGARFTDNGTTVTDNLTGLVWEKKTNLDSIQNFADPHDADNLYLWCSDSTFEGVCDNDAADGTAFTDFLRSLNSGGCFAGQCDWRLPTKDELQTILADPYTPGAACTTPSCIDAIFGPTQSLRYWSATPSVFFPDVAWNVVFAGGDVRSNLETVLAYVRAVRGGL